MTIRLWQHEMHCSGDRSVLVNNVVHGSQDTGSLQCQLRKVTRGQSDKKPTDAKIPPRHRCDRTVEQK
ncbi:hypothetical protein AYM40_29135 [Paraburkholderia phytofirmans OLGA172]|uniref:Uncharacterized protein n=1 Tax=Paraburkholderia phytofirmans OLGA172 TaxID=1417228 RepID=A0A161ICP0_9BURK|nr:hypothetical protein AYM40_29135 [Paraburkholderia phytofirmans OLGA172]